MIMLLDKTKVKFERQQRAWSQAQLAESSGMSLRTVQRIEKDGKASLESAKALAAVFGFPVNQLYLTEIEEGEVTEPLTANLEQQQFAVNEYLTSKAKTLSATAFLLLSLIFLLLSTVKVVTLAGAFGYALILSIVIGLIFDALRNEGLLAQLKSHIQSEHFSLESSAKQLKQSLFDFAKFFKKPLLITGMVVTIAGSVTYLNMEDYQKARLSVFLSELF